LVVAIMLVVVVAAVGVGSVKGQLSMGFYANSCPGAESIITTAVRTASVVDPVLPAKILRLFFHDCFVQVRNYSFNSLHYQI
jgi:peroxidase